MSKKTCLSLQNLFVDGAMFLIWAIILKAVCLSVVSHFWASDELSFYSAFLNNSCALSYPQSLKH